MPQNLTGLSAAAGFARGFGPQFAASRRQRLEQELAGREKEEQNLAKAMKLMKDLGLEETARYRELGMQRLGGLIPGFEETMRRPIRYTPLGDLEAKFKRPMMQPRLAGETTLRASPQMRADILAGGRARMAPKPSPGALRTRFTALYDREKRKADAIDVKIRGIQMTLPEPKPGFLGIFDNQAEIDSIQAQIDSLKQQRAKIQSNMDRVVSEGRKRFGPDIVFDISPPPTVAPKEGLLTREEFIQAYINDPMNTQKMSPSEAIIEQAKGIDWE